MSVHRSSSRPALPKMGAGALRTILVGGCLLFFGAAVPSARALDLDDPFRAGPQAGTVPWRLPADRPGGHPCADHPPATPLTAVDAVDLALCNHPQTREVWANARAQAALVGAARASELPSLDGRGSVGQNWTNGREFAQNSAALTLSWLAFDFGTRAANLENAQYLLAAARTLQDAAVQQLFLAALQAYYGAQAARAAVDAALEAERAAQESFQAADARYRVGVATPADRLQAQTAWSQATLNRIRAEGDLRNAFGALANAMGFDAQQPFALADTPAAAPGPGFEKDVVALIDEAKRRRPELMAAEAQAAAARANVRATRASGLPTVTVSAGPTWQDVSGRSTEGGVIGVTLTAPLFSGFATTYRVRSAEATVDARDAQAERLRQQVTLDVWQSYQNLSTAGQARKTAADLVASALAAEEMALGRYKAGVGSILDVLNAQSALASARRQRIQADLDWNVSRAALARSMGALDYTLLLPAEGKK